MGTFAVLPFTGGQGVTTGMPWYRVYLFALAALRLRCAAIGILSITAGAGSARVAFKPKADVDPAALIRFIQSNPRKHRFDGATTIVAQWDRDSATERLEGTTRLLDQLHPETAETGTSEPA